MNLAYVFAAILLFESLPEKLTEVSKQIAGEFLSSISSTNIYYTTTDMAGND